METKFTKGEWIAIVDDDCAVVECENKCVADNDMSDIPVDESKANAHLIAAAPEMYNMLESILIEQKSNGGDGVTYPIEQLLNKARGE